MLGAAAIWTLKAVAAVAMAAVAVALSLLILIALNLWIFHVPLSTR